MCAYKREAKTGREKKIENTREREREREKIERERERTKDRKGNRKKDLRQRKGLHK